jgi:transcription elongation GreA/GreB family factor/transcription elongation factor GreA-like protein
MSANAERMLKLVASGSYGKVEEEWTATVEDPETDLHTLVPVLRALANAGQNESAELLAWSTVGPAREQLDPQACLKLIKEMFFAVPNSEDLRSELVSQYKIVHSDAPQLERLVEACGLADGSRKPKLALRTLELCLVAEPGSYLLSRQDESVAEVVAVEDGCRSYTVKFDRRTREYEPAELAREFGPIDPDDFRVLTQCRPERLAELLDQDASGLIVSVLKARGGKLTADDLRYTLCPRHLPPDKWSKWWTKARAGLKKNHVVRLEGRSPVTLVYDPGGWSVEQMSWESFPKSESTPDYYEAVESYFRQAKSRRQEVCGKHLSRMAGAVHSRLRQIASHSPDGGLGLALVLQGLVERGAQVEVEPSASPAEIVGGADRPAELLRNLSDGRLWAPALEAARKGCPDSWVEVFCELLPKAPAQACEVIAGRLPAEERIERLNRCLEQALESPDECLEALAWIWKGSDYLDGVSVPTRLELLTKMLGTLADLQRNDQVAAERLKQARTTVKNALSAGKYRGFKECLETIDEGMASALRNRLRRLDGLGVVLVEDLVEEIRKRFPRLWAQKKEAPWKDPSAIYCTTAGMQKLEKEIDQVVNVEMPANAKAIGEAASRGDLSENSEYKFALEARDMLRARLAKLQQQLSIARLIDRHDIPTEHVGVGSKVVIRRTSDNATRSLTFLGPWEAAIDQGIYNYQAPLSQRFMGRTAGETISLEQGDGEGEWIIERIEPGL